MCELCAGVRGCVSVAVDLRVSCVESVSVLVVRWRRVVYVACVSPSGFMNQKPRALPRKAQAKRHRTSVLYDT